MDYLQRIKYNRKRLVHTGYIFSMEDLSDEDKEKLMPFFEYSVTKTKKSETITTHHTIPIKEHPYVAMEYASGYAGSEAEQSKVDMWYQKRKDTTNTLYVKGIYSDTKHKLVVIEGHLEGKPCWITLSDTDSGLTAIAIKKMVAKGTLGQKKNLTMKIECRVYGYTNKEKFF